MPEPVLTTARTPRHALPFLFPGQAQKEAFVNEALARLDALVQPGVLGEASAPPTAPSSGDSYIVGPAASGTWAGHAGHIATWARHPMAVRCPAARRARPRWCTRLARRVQPGGGVAPRGGPRGSQRGSGPG